MLKSDELMALEKAGVVYQDRSTGSNRGNWYNGFKDDVDLTPYLIKANMFEQ